MNSAAKLRKIIHVDMDCFYAAHEVNLEHYLSLLRQLYARENKPIRLIGLGVHFDNAHENSTDLQLPLLD